MNAEKALHTDQDSYRLLFERSPIGICHFDEQGIIRACNPAFLRLLGASAEALRDFDMLARVKNPGILSAVYATLGGQEGRYEGPYESVTSGRVSTARVSMFPLHGPDGRLQGGLALAEDITEVAQTQAELHHLQSLLKASVEQSPMGILVADGPDARVRLLNQAAANLLGQEDPGPAHSGNTWAAFHPDGRPYPAEDLPLHRALSRGELTRNEEIRIVQADGSERWIQASGSPLRDEQGAIQGAVVAFADITEARKAREALAASETQFRLLTEQAADAILVGDPAGRIIGANARAAELTGRSVESLLGLHIRDLFAPATLARQPLRFDLLNTGQRVVLERELQRADGSRVPVEMSSVRLPDGRYQSILRDQTERLEAERRLRETEARYLDIFNNTPDNLFRIRVEPDGGFRVEAANPAQLAALGLPPEALIGKRLEEFLPPDLCEPIQSHYRACLEQGESLTYEESANLPEGHRWFQTLLVPVRDAEGSIRHLIGFSRDITQRRQAEEALQQASKLESLGVLAGGIAHDFNNLLTAILGNLNLAQDHLGAGSAAHPFLEKAEQTVLKASELTRQMLAYSGRGRFVVEPLDLNGVVQELTHLLRVSISKRITLRLDLGPGLPNIEADAAQVQQVVMNLVTNASDAIGDSDGAILLGTSAVELSEKDAAACFPARSLHPGRHVCLAVADSGCGMNAEVMARIFDPFYSTKATGRGLGLSAMLGILRGHAAGLRIESSPGRGSRFQIFFPASDLPTAEAAPLEPAALPRSGGVILVVDDEPAIRESAAIALEAMGFEVIQAADGIEALERFSPRAQEIRLVLLDLTMPRMDGAQTFEALRQIRAELPIVLSSGYSGQESTRPFQDRGLAGFLAKPYQIKDLRRMVAGILGTP